MEEKSLSESSELLRLALPLMGKYTVPATPDNYAVWYSYVAGENPPLKEKMDDMIQKGGVVGAGLTELLYKEYLDPSRDMAKTERAQQKLHSLADSITQTIENASGDVNRYEKSLKVYEDKISDGMQPEQVQQLISELSGLASDMHEGNDSILEDLIETRREAETLRKELQVAKTEALTDPLTSLANRKAFFDRIEEMRSSGESNQSGHCILMVDIDKFKLVNDTYGHLFGDKVIKIVATIMTKLTKGNDLAARFGGEEFIILLPDTDIIGAQTVAENIRKSMESGRIIKPKSGEEITKVTLSVGISTFSLDETVEESIARADEALYAAKNNGRNRVEVCL